MKKTAIALLVVISGCQGKESTETKNTAQPPMKIDYCSRILGGQEKEDKSKVFMLDEGGFSIFKEIKNGEEPRYTVSLEGESVDEIKGYGVNIQLSDGYSINRSDQLVMSSRNRVKGNYRNYTIFDITENEVRKIAKDGVHGFIINVNYVRIDSSDLIKNMVLCLLDKK